MRMMFKLKESRDEWLDKLSKVAKAIARAREIDDDDVCDVEIQVRLEGSLSTIKNHEALKAGVIRDIALSVGGLIDKISVAALYADLSDLEAATEKTANHKANTFIFRHEIRERGAILMHLVLQRGVCGAGVSPLVIAQVLVGRERGREREGGTEGGMGGGGGRAGGRGVLVAEDELGFGECLHQFVDIFIVNQQQNDIYKSLTEV